MKKELPRETERFIGIDKEVKAILKEGEQIMKCLVFCTRADVMPRLEEVQKQLTLCEKALNDFMDSKRRAFPRFYFVSPADLLDILSNGNNPKKVMVHLPKIFQAVETLMLKDDGGVQAVGIDSCVGKEYVEFTRPLKLVGKVETYLQDVINQMRKSLNEITEKSVKAFPVMAREEWLRLDPSQVTLLVNMVQWVTDVEDALRNLKSDANAVKQAHKNQVATLTALIKMVQGDLDKPMRQKIMCMITMDTHSRDIIGKLVEENVRAPDEFQW